MNGLTGKYVVITRAWHQASEFSQRLEAHHAVPLFYPCVEIAPPVNVASLDSHVTALFAGSFDWLVLTSQNAVIALSSRMKALRIHQPLPSTLRFAAMGGATAAAAHDLLGIDIHAIGQIYDLDSLGRLLESCDGKRVLVPQADIARPELVSQLEQAGALVTRVMAYQTLKGSGGIRLVDYIAKKQIDVVTFASPSAVNFFKERLLDEGGSLESLKSACIACVNGVTQKAATEAGFDVGLVAKAHSVDSLIHGLKDHFSV